MSLEDIKIAQATAIGNLSVLDPEGDACAEWIPFRNSLWGKPLKTFLAEGEVVERDDNPIKAVPTDHPVRRSVATVHQEVPWTLYSEKILVRSEYKEAEEAAVRANGPYIHAFVVGGQPGIGKSVFLLYLLMRRLASKLPTVLQINASYAILFHEGGVAQLSNLDNDGKYLPINFPVKKAPYRIWALIDLNPNLPQPAAVFRYQSPFFIVCAVSPRSPHTEWLNKLGKRRFYMKPWSTLEVIQSRSFLGTGDCSERQLFRLFRRYGASARALALNGADPEPYKDELRRCIDEIKPDDLPHIFRDPASFQNSHYIITIHPQEGHRGAIEKRFASRRVFDMVWEKHLASRVDLMEQFYNLFLATPITATPAGWVFEDRIHQVLRTEQTLRLFPILPHSGRTNVIFDNYTASKARSNPTEFHLTASEEHPLVKRAKLVENHYCRPEFSNFAAVDSVLLIHPPDEPPVLFMFQMTRNKTKHGTNLEGLRKVDTLDVPPDTRRYLVIVTPENIHPRITVPLEYFGGTVPIQSDGRNIDESEDIKEDEDEEMDDDEDEEMGEKDDGKSKGKDDGKGKGKDDGTGGSQWELFRVFHCPIDMGRLFNQLKVGS